MGKFSLDINIINLVAFKMKKLKKQNKLTEEQKKRKEIEDKYNPTIPKKDDGLCVRCHKNKATINYTDSIMRRNIIIRNNRDQYAKKFTNFRNLTTAIL